MQGGKTTTKALIIALGEFSSFRVDSPIVCGIMFANSDS